MASSTPAERAASAAARFDRRRLSSSPKPMEIYLSVNDFPDSISQLPKRKEENIIYEVVCKAF
jgi:hypothetical protein